MRIKVSLKSLQDANYDLIHNYILQGFIYDLLKDSPYAWLHSHKSFKYFTFSNIFPVAPFKIDNIYNFIISSPNKDFINYLYKKLKSLKSEKIKLGSLYFKIENVKKFDISLKFPWITGTPIVLRKCKEVIISDGFRIYKIYVKNIDIFKKLGFKKEKIKIENFKDIPEISISDLKYLDRSKFRIIKIRDIYYHFKGGDSLFEWLRDLKNQSILKYKLYTNNFDFYFEDPLFEIFKIRREVYIKFRLKDRGDVTYIGSLWYKLGINRKLTISEKKFYKFLLDGGLGSLNSLGFGFMNPLYSKLNKIKLL